MRPRHSDVFEEYAKIALERGLISNAQEEKDSSKKTEKKEDSKELSNAEILYGIKQVSTHELLQQAHPKTVVMGPAYDALNGVVEDLELRSNVMQHIALKNPKILQTNTRYVKAYKDLLDETVKLGFYLDNKNQNSLMKLADSCTQELTKEANWKLKLLKLLGIGAAAGLTTGVATQYMAPSQGLVRDTDLLIEKISEVKSVMPADAPQHLTEKLLKIDTAALAIKELAKLAIHSDPATSSKDGLVKIKSALEKQLITLQDIPEFVKEIKPVLESSESSKSGVREVGSEIIDVLWVPALESLRYFYGNTFIGSKNEFLSLMDRKIESLNRPSTSSPKPATDSKVKF